MITFEHVSKTFDHQQMAVVDDVSFQVQDGEIFVLLGSSGSGKTTLLKMMNRLVEPNHGRVLIDKVSVDSYPLIELRRSIGYVFQGIGLFPQMTIEQNISIVLKLMGRPKWERQQRALELMHMIHLDPSKYAQRFPHELSGGQQQRVGVARALAANPNYLLLDEPFGALDAVTRHKLQQEIIDLNALLKKTIIFVTHDLHEAFMLADRIGVMHNGKLEQVGSVQEIQQHPRTKFVRQLILQYSQNMVARGEC